MTGWDWERAARRLGADRDGRFNAARTKLGHERALVWRRADGSTTAYSGEDLRELGQHAAAVLRHAGIDRGDRVAGLLGRRPEAFAVPLGAWQLGAVYVPLFSGFRTDALRVRLSDSGTTVIVTDPANRASLVGVEDDRTIALVGGSPHDGELGFDDLGAELAPHREYAETTLADAGAVTYTSGTSGQPKGCVIPHRAVVNLTSFVERCLGLTSHDLLFSTADTGWSFGLYTTGFAPMSLGCPRLLYEGSFDAGDWWATIEELGVTHLASAPTGFRQLTLAGEAPIQGRSASLRALTAAGEPLDPDAIRWFEDAVGLTVHDCYGLTELGMVVANGRGPGAPAPVPGSMGHSVSGFDVQVLDADGRRAPTGEEGRLAVRDEGWFLSSTYWGRDEEWQGRLEDGWWITEDRARTDADGRFWYVGRSDDVIVTAGYNVSPFEVESVLMEHPAVAEAACVGEPDERKGQVVAAHLVLAPGHRRALDEELRQLVGERIGWHAAPRRFHVRPQLPKTESGKLRRSALRDPISEVSC